LRLGGQQWPPGRVSLRTVVPVLRQTLCDVWAGNAMEWAAALAFYAVLSIFPLVLAGAALATFVVDPSVVATRLSNLLEGFVPPGVVDIQPIVAAAIASRRNVGIFAILVWLIAGRRILGALVTALDRVSDVDERHESLRRRAAVEVVLLVGIGALFVIALSARSLFGLL
jgi:membrane protein